MTKLLKADLRRLFKDKLLLVMGILAVVFASITPLLYAVLFSDPEMSEDLLQLMQINGKTQFFASFSMGNNLGLIAPVLLAIALWKDFSFGTIRNKLIAGYRRSDIYASLFITCSVVLIGVMVLHAFLTLGISLLFFPYQATAFTLADLWYFLESLAFELLVLLFVSALLTYLCANAKNAGLLIVLYIAVALLFVLAGGVTKMAVEILEATGGKESTLSLLRFLDRVNVGNASTYIGMGTAYGTEDVLYLTIPALTGILGLSGLGLWQFGKKDLK